MATRNLAYSTRVPSNWMDCLMQTTGGSDLMAHRKQTKRPYSAETSQNWNKLLMEASKGWFPYRDNDEGMSPGRGPCGSAAHGRRGEEELLPPIQGGFGWLVPVWNEVWRCCLRGRRRGSDECGWQTSRRLREAAASPREGNQEDRAELAPGGIRDSGTEWRWRKRREEEEKKGKSEK